MLHLAKIPNLTLEGVHPKHQGFFKKCRDKPNDKNEQIIENNPI